MPPKARSSCGRSLGVLFVLGEQVRADWEDVADHVLGPTATPVPRMLAGASVWSALFSPGCES